MRLEEGNWWRKEWWGGQGPFFYPVREEKQTEQKGEGLFSVVIDWLVEPTVLSGQCFLRSSFYILHSPWDGWQAWQQDLMMILHLSLKNVAGYVCFNIYVRFFSFNAFCCFILRSLWFNGLWASSHTHNHFFPSVVVVCTEAPVGILTAGSCLLLVKNVGFKALFK